MSNIRSRYSGRKAVSLVFSGPSRTKQSFKNECDINNIMRKWQRDGVITHVNRFQGSYSDLSNAQDYQESLNIVMAAQESFMSLPSSIRSIFSNDPSKFLDFIDNPDNREQCEQLGLLPRSPEPATGDDVDVAPDHPRKRGGGGRKAPVDTDGRGPSEPLEA